MPQQAQSIRILMVEDHSMVRSGLKMLLESYPELNVLGAVGTRAEALALAEQGQPDVIVLDLDLGADNGLDLLPQLQASVPSAKVLILTGLRDPETHRRAMQLGAAGLVLKEKAADVLVKALVKVHAGEFWYDRSLMSSMVVNMQRNKHNQQVDEDAARIARLTKREREIITHLAEGLRNKEIAARLHISENTARHHLSSIFSKLEVEDRFELIIFSFRHGLAKPPFS
jgi:two-component system, NarL family, nitrate/nitrite response regulator NarL